MDKTIKKWNIKTRYQGSSKTVATVIPDGWEQRSEYETTVVNGWTGDLAEEIEKYKADIDWDAGSMTTYELSYNTETPLGSLTIKKGSAYIPKDGDWREPIPLGYGFYICGTSTNKDEDYIKVHEPWVPATTDGT